MIKTDSKKMFIESFGQFLNNWKIANVQAIKYMQLDNGMEVAEIHYRDSRKPLQLANITGDSYLSAIKYILGILQLNTYWG